MTHKPHRRLALALLCLLGIAVIAPSIRRASAVPALAPLFPEAAAPNDRGAAGLGQAIRRLGVVASVLHTGAHPDDESSDLLAYLARGRQARTAYLALTRGDGGQNLVGPELYELLGVIRTDELLAARRIDGASQFFTRAFDFGFSKSRDETLSKWDREAVLSDMVRVIRTFRPLVIASQFGGTSSDGHGHHQAAGFLTPEAYRAAADPSRFPEQIAEGLRPWKAKKLYVGARDRGQGERDPAPPQGTLLTINTGQFDPLLGRSYYEVAMEGRSQHRSQDQGALQRRGPQYRRLRLIEGPTSGVAQEKDIFDGIDISLMGIAEYAGTESGDLKRGLSEVQKAADEAKENYGPFSTSNLRPIIARGLKRIRNLRSSLAGMGLKGEARYEVDFLLTEKERDFEAALAKAGGVVVDCLSEDEIVTPGQTFNLSVFAYADGDSKDFAVSLSAPPGWSAVEKKRSSSVTDGRLAAQADFQVTVAPDAGFTQPYWLLNARNKDV
ncbi:MAG TPA: PIG-L family deacetylase, partial [Blastocatellia bacterium]|nr:PIG-L family deacetylase [Blastocatellia bacterium]